MSYATAKCAGDDCPIREQCDRFVRPAVDGQLWIHPAWCYLPSADMDYPETYSKRSCADWQRVKTPAPQPHGGAAEEGDGA